MPQSREEQLAYKRQYNAERAAFLKEHNLCAWCGKEKALDGKRLCWTCWDKDRERSYQKYHAMSVEEKKASQKKTADYRKALRKKRREQGLCTLCGKKAPAGRVTCYACSNKRNAYSMSLRRKKGIISFDERGNGIYCIRCCKPVEIQGNKLCSACYEKSVKQAEHMREFTKITPSWRGDNERVFRKRSDPNVLPHQTQSRS